MIYQDHAHRKLRQAFDAILQQFSSNGNRKSMLSANRSFQAQNSTCSTLLPTMLLHETCIVLSRKCLWDVNKDFWHQWRSLVITTLSARPIYRQIPVSYLQTWYIESAIVHAENSSISSLYIVSSQKNPCQQFPKHKNPYVEAYHLMRLWIFRFLTSQKLIIGSTRKYITFDVSW